MTYKLSEIIGKKIAVHCETQEQWDKVVAICGLRWKINYFQMNDFKLCINPTTKAYDSIVYYLNCLFEIIPATKFIAANAPQQQDPIQPIDAAWLNRLANHVGVRMNGLKEMADTLTGEQAEQLNSIISHYADAINITQVLTKNSKQLKDK